MKKIIALTTLVAATSALAASTTATKIDVSSMSLKERISFSYYGEMDKDNLDKSKDPKQATAFYNSFTMKYKMTEDITASINPRFEVTDRNTSDYIDEGDVRVGIKKANIYTSANGMVSTSVTVKLELPTSKGSEDSDKLTRVKLYVGTNVKIDDYNNFYFLPYYNKSINTQSAESVGETAKYNISSWSSYTNSSFSEKALLRLDIETSISHMSGYTDNNLKSDKGDERILAGVDFDMAGTSVYPYLQHNTSGVKAADMLGAGVQVSASF
jgi:hypothetical protein